jgi:S1-C subfamily serine protease
MICTSRMSATEGLPRLMAGVVFLSLLLLLCSWSPILAQEPFENSVVRVYLTRDSVAILHGDRLIRQPRIREEAEFTGIITGPEGHVVTYVGHHWFRFGLPGASVWVETADGERKRARLAGVDERIALVVLDSEARSTDALKPGELTRDSKVRVVAPLRGRLTVSAPVLVGVNSHPVAPEREVQFLAPERLERRHWEGGAVFDESGSFLGIVTISGAHLFSRRIEVCQVLPAAVIEESVKRILTHQADLKAGWLGVHLANLSPRRFVVERVVPGSPAEKAGLRPGDRLAAIDGLPVDDLQRFERLIRWKGAGGLARIFIERQARIEELKVHLTERRDSFPAFFWALEIPRGWEHGLRPGEELHLYQTAVPWPLKFGFLVDAVAPQQQELLNCPEGEGFLVREIVPGSPAEKAGFKAGDVLTRINGRSVVAFNFRHLTPRLSPVGGLRVQFVRDCRLQERTLDAPRN